MDKAIVERALRALAALNTAHPPEAVSSPVQADARASLGQAENRAATSAAWPPASLDAERRFGQPHAKLFPFIGRKVRTPAGPGTLLQVFAERVTVVLDSQLKRCARFAPGEIEPVTWEFSE